MAKKRINVIRITENDLNRMIVQTAMQMDEGKWANRVKSFTKGAGTLGLGAAGMAGLLYANDKFHENDKEDPETTEMKNAQRDIIKSKEFDDYHKNDAKWPEGYVDHEDSTATNEGTLRFGKNQLCEIINRGARRLIEISTKTKQKYMDGQVAKKEGKRPLSKANLKSASKYMKDLDKKGIPHSKAKTPEETARLMAGDKASKVMQDNRGKLKPTSEAFNRVVDKIIAEEIRKALKS